MVTSASLLSLEQTSVSLEIGDPQIDQEHEALLRTLQRMNETPDSREGRDDFFDKLSQLGRELSQHFDHEEALMKWLGMPEELIASHMQAHEHIISQYTELNIDLMHGKRFEEANVLKLVQDWILNHITVHDLKIRNFIRRQSQP